VVAGDNARSRVWAVYGSLDAIGLSCGPIGMVQSLSTRGSGKEGSQNMGSMEVIWGVDNG
jgi:hypothetical protein